MMNPMLYHAPVVTLERLPFLEWLEKTIKKSDDPLNEEPKRKKFKNEEEKGEIPKLILSKDGNSFQSKLKFSNPDMLKNYQESDLLSATVNTNTELDINQNKKSIKKKRKKKKKKSKMKKPILNCSLVDKIQVCDLNSINNNYDLKQKEINCVDKEKANISIINDSLTFEQLGTSEQTFEHFRQLHKKYFSKSVQDTIVIINNIVFINLLTNMHCISRINVILSWKDKYEMAKNIQCQTMLHIMYIKILDNIIKNNCFDVISVFEDSHFEHALLTFILSLFTNLKVFGSNILNNSNVLLKKLEHLDWSSVKNNEKKIDHNKIQTTLKSDIFRSTYLRLSQFIGEGSNTDPDVIKFWELFSIQPMIKTSYFHLAVEALLNDAGIEKVISSIDQASNKIRLETKLEDSQNSSSSNKIELRKLISLVNNSTKGIIYSNDTAQPSTNGLNNSNETYPAQAKNNEIILTPHIVHTSSLRTLKPDRLDENFPYKCQTNIPETMIPNSVQFSQVKNSSSTVSPPLIDLSKPCQTFKQIPIENLSTPHIFHTSNLRTSVISTRYTTENFPNTSSIKIQEQTVPNQVCQIENTLTTVSSGLIDSQKSCKTIQNNNIHTPHIIHTKSLRKTDPNTFYEKYKNIIEVNTTPTTNNEQVQTNHIYHAYLHKKFGNILYRVDQNEMIKKPNVTSIEVDSNISVITMDFDRSEKCIGFTIRVQKWSLYIQEKLINSIPTLA